MKRLLSIMLALMLMLSMTATAFAADGKVDPTTPSAHVTKEYIDGVGHAATFKYDVTKITQKNAPDLTIADIPYTDAEKGGIKTSNLVFSNITVAGEYKYTVKENQTGEINNEHEKMIMSDAQYRVEIIVTGNTGGKLAISNIAVYKTHNDNGVALDPEEKVGADGFKFVNTYALEAGSQGPDYDSNGSLKISKTVIDGDDPDQEFSFVLTLVTPGGVNPFIPKAIYSDGREVLINAHREYNFSLKNGEWVKFVGYPVGSTTTVGENAVPFYTASAKYQFGTQTGTITAPVSTAAIEVSGTLTESTNKVDVTNTRVYTPPMGVILNVLPYVLMVAIAGGMIVLFTVLKRRNAQDNED